MLRGIIIILLLGLSLCTSPIRGEGLLPPECYDTLIQNLDCSWYETCLQAAFQCPEDGYPIGYGYKYCSRGLRLEPLLTPRQADWFQRTLKCLKGSLKDILREQDVNRNVTCETLEKVAFNSHVKCYTQNGFCHLFSIMHPFVTGRFLQRLSMYYDVRDLFSKYGRRQVVKTGMICVKKWLFN